MSDQNAKTWQWLPSGFREAIVAGDLAGSRAAVDWLKEEGDEESAGQLRILIGEIEVQSAVGRHLRNLLELACEKFFDIEEAAPPTSHEEVQQWLMERVFIPASFFDSHHIYTEADFESSRPLCHVVAPPGDADGTFRNLTLLLEIMSRRWPHVHFEGRERFWPESAPSRRFGDRQRIAEPEDNIEGAYIDNGASQVERFPRHYEPLSREDDCDWVTLAESHARSAHELNFESRRGSVIDEVLDVVIVYNNHPYPPLEGKPGRDEELAEFRNRLATGGYTELAFGSYPKPGLDDHPGYTFAMVIDGNGNTEAVNEFCSAAWQEIVIATVQARNA